MVTSPTTYHSRKLLWASEILWKVQSEWTQAHYMIDKRAGLLKRKQWRYHVATEKCGSTSCCTSLNKKLSIHTQYVFTWYIMILWWGFDLLLSKNLLAFCAASDVSQSCYILPSERLTGAALNRTKLVSFPSLSHPSLLLYFVPHSSSCWLPFISELLSSFRCMSWLRSSSRAGSQFALRAKTVLASLHGMRCARGSWWILMIQRAPRNSNCPCFNSTSRCGVCAQTLPGWKWNWIGFCNICTIRVTAAFSWGP